MRKKSCMRYLSRALSRIFCLGRESILEKFLESRSGEKSFFKACRGSVGMLPRKILKTYENFFLRGGAETFGGKLPPLPSRQDPANYYEIGPLRSLRARGSFTRRSGLF